jgi:hypothetical protein
MLTNEMTKFVCISWFYLFTFFLSRSRTVVFVILSVNQIKHCIQKKSKQFDVLGFFSFFINFLLKTLYVLMPVSKTFVNYNSFSRFWMFYIECVRFYSMRLISKVKVCRLSSATSENSYANKAPIESQKSQPSTFTTSENSHGNRPP